MNICENNKNNELISTSRYINNALC